MRYSQVKAVTFEEITKYTALTVDLSVSLLMLPRDPTGQFSSKSENCPVVIRHLSKPLNIEKIPLILS